MNRREFVKLAGTGMPVAALAEAVVSAQQAQAQLMQILTQIGKAQQPPINMRSSEIGGLVESCDRERYGSWW